MTTEEKLQHFYEVSIESAKEEADNAISEYRTSLEKELEKHKKEKLAASENQFKIESENAAREINKALSAEHLHIKRRLSKKYQELQEKLFEEVKEMLQTFLAGPQYGDWLEEKINKALEAAGIDHIQVKGLRQVVLPLDEDKSCRAAVQAAPSQALIEAFTQPDAAFQLVQCRQSVRRYAFDRVPLAQHIIDHQADHVLHHPIPAIQGVKQRIVVRHTGERILCRLKRRLTAVPQVELPVSF